jgi:phosphate-selective porin OprO and OprP
MYRSLWKNLGRNALCGAALLAGASLAEAQSLPTIPQTPPVPAAAQKAPALGQPSNPSVVPTVAPAPANDAAEMKARIDRLEQQNQELMNLLKGLQKTPATTASAIDGTASTALSAQDVRQIITGYFAEQDAQKKAEEKIKSDAGYKVGTDLRMNATWQNGVVFETPNKDFWMRAGFRFQWDNVWFHQTAQNAKNDGKLLDGDYFRRVRPNFSGGFWEVGEFNVEIKLENVQNGLNGMDDVWVGVKDIPWIGTVRAGHFHLAHGLEADMYSSSKPMTFFEVYSGNNAFFSGERCGSGLWLTNSFLNDRMTYAAMAYRPENADNGADFANGDYAGILRLTGLPIYENDGRCLLHLGGAATFRHARNNPITGAAGSVNFQTDLEMRDRSGGDDGYGNNLNPTPPGFAASPGNSTRFVSTSAIAAASSTIYGAELLYINGPFSIQAEYDWAFIDGATVAKKGVGDLGFTGGYVQVSYFLTGENRTYDKRLGRLGGEYIARANTPFWLVKGDNGRLNYGLGAWELAARFSTIDLDSGALQKNGTHLVQGGILDQWEAGVNWHLNNNLRVQFMFLHADIYGQNSKAIGGTPIPGSWANGFGIRTQLTF